MEVPRVVRKFLTMHLQNTVNTVSDEGVDEDYDFSKAVQRTKNNNTGPPAFFLATKRTGLEQTPSKSKRFKFNCLPEDWGTRLELESKSDHHQPPTPGVEHSQGLDEAWRTKPEEAVDVLPLPSSAKPDTNTTQPNPPSPPSQALQSTKNENSANCR